MPEQTNATRAAEIATSWRNEYDPQIPTHHLFDLMDAITAALNEARRTALEEAAKVVGDLKANPGVIGPLYSAGVDAGLAGAVAVIRALLDPRPAAKNEGER